MSSATSNLCGASSRQKKVPDLGEPGAKEANKFTASEIAFSSTQRQDAARHISTFSRPGERRSLVAFDLSEGEPERFPIDAFPPFLQTIAGNMALVYQTPVCMPAMSTLAVLSGSVGKSVIVRGGYKDKETRLNIYVVAAAERGSGKGNIGELLAAPFAERSQEEAARHRETTASKRGELGLLKKRIQQLENSGANAKGVDRHQTGSELTTCYQSLFELERESKRHATLWVQNATSEGIMPRLADNLETLFSFSSEAGAALKVALGKYTDGSDFDWLLSCYSGDRTRIDRAGRDPIELQSPCLSMLWLVQPCVLKELCGCDEAFSRGLTARPLIFETGARREHDNGQELAFLHGDQWRDFISAILTARLTGQTPRVINCDSQARAVFSEFHNESVDLERGPFADVVGELSRWRENAIKVAGLFALAEKADKVTADCATRAVRVVRWAGFNYLSVLQAGRKARRQGELDRVLKLIANAGGEISMGELSRNHGVKRAEVEALVAAFHEEIEIEKRPQGEGKAGRPSEVLRVISKSSFSTKSAYHSNKGDLLDLERGGQPV
jgi:hypothetical protein